MTAPTSAEVRDRIAPGPELGVRIRAFLDAQLGGILPKSPGRGVDWYYDWVVLGDRALEAYRILEPHLATAAPIVDIGAGTGSFVLLARSCGHTAFGVEPGDEASLARDRWLERGDTSAPPFTRGVGERLPFRDGSVGALLLHDVLEHVDDWRSVLAECRRVIRPGGVAYIKGPSYAFRFVEPHYRLPWLPLLPKAIARRYVVAMGRDPGYLGHLGYRRRGAVLRELSTLGFDIELPRRQKLAEIELINRGWVRTLARPFAPGRRLGRVGAVLADQPLQSVMDVLARVPE